jgi:hypothetical protein
MQPEIDSSEQERVKLLIKKAELKAECAKLKAENVEYVKLKAEISKFEAENVKLKAENTKFLNSIKKDYADFEAPYSKIKAS